METFHSGFTRPATKMDISALAATQTNVARCAANSKNGPRRRSSREVARAEDDQAGALDENTDPDLQETARKLKEIQGLRLLIRQGIDDGSKALELLARRDFPGN